MARNRRSSRLASLLGVLLLGGVLRTGNAEEGPASASPATGAPEVNMVGAYGPWLSKQVLGDGPARMSFRTGRWKSLDAWRKAARERTWDRIAPVDQGGKPEVRVDSTHEFDGLHIERLSWQLPGGPRTEAVFLKPIGAEGPLPAILGLHDHGGNKFLGWRKIARIDDRPAEIVLAHQKDYYGGVAWANEVAKRGYAVLVHDTFPFGSRRVRVADVSPRVHEDGIDPEANDPQGVKRYNKFAGAHEDVMEKSLISAGTTWPASTSSRTSAPWTSSARDPRSTRSASAAPGCRAEGCEPSTSAAWTIASDARSPSGS